MRVAWRDISRNRSRSAAAIGAAAIALAIPFGIASFTASLATTWAPRVPTNAAAVQAEYIPTADERATEPATAAGGNVLLAEDPPPFVAIRSIALAIGDVFGLSAVAAAVALIRSEAANEGRVLTAVGAAPTTSRSIGAFSVVGLILSAGVIAVASVFVLLAGVYLNPDEAFFFTMPWAELAAVLVLLPLAGGTAAWLLTSPKAFVTPSA